MAKFVIDEVVQISGVAGNRVRGVIILGTVKEGVIQAGSKIIINGKTVEVRCIERAHRPLETANTGDTVGIQLQFMNEQPPDGLFKKLIGSSKRETEEYTPIKTELLRCKGQEIEFLL